MVNGIYAYIDKEKENEVVYVGLDSYIDKNKRYNDHISPSRYDDQPFNRILQNNPNRYEYRVLRKGNFPYNWLKALEIIYIRRYNPKFNFTIGGDGVLGFKHSEETKKKISELKKGKNHPMFGKKGKNHPMFGKHHSEESIKKMSKTKKGKKLSEETKKKISELMKGKNNPMFGKHHSEESIKKMSKAKNTSGYYRVYKHKNKNCKQGFTWEYRWTDKNGKRKKLSSVNIKKLEKKVKEKGLIWKKITN